MGVYENQAWIGLPGHAMRPGGLALTERLLELAQLQQGAGILVLGCGMGGTVAHLDALGYQALGVDCSPDLIRCGQAEYPQSRLMVARGENLPFAEGSWEAVLAECSLSVMEQPDVLLACAHVLKPGGKLLISDVYARQEASESALSAVEVRRFLTRAKWEELLDRCGFRRLLWEDHTAVWKEFAAQVIWEYGSLSVLGDCRLGQDIALVKPGYFLALADKERKECDHNG
ncbi:DVU_1556 family methyltransferase [Candidatus Formimonas warabiya]|uniref:Methyltransferase type 11 domain-containing protein n=1 Tax=Formimonas warabiya TaxID=1761012 RepID=A0A3G1KTE5_FORW1|nr:class I SAM-dependent methyltransferase [Candidatus Formimonas warabiya]ATW25738.1 hypothetical protein DCMF_14075 [Candidatus Formimonas warabiya]